MSQPLSTAEAWRWRSTKVRKCGMKPWPKVQRRRHSIAPVPLPLACSHWRPAENNFENSFYHWAYLPFSQLRELLLIQTRQQAGSHALLISYRPVHPRLWGGLGDLPALGRLSQGQYDTISVASLLQAVGWSIGSWTMHPFPSVWNFPFMPFHYLYAFPWIIISAVCLSEPILKRNLSFPRTPLHGRTWTVWAWGALTRLPSVRLSPAIAGKSFKGKAEWQSILTGYPQEGENAHLGLESHAQGRWISQEQYSAVPISSFPMLSWYCLHELKISCLASLERASSFYMCLQASQTIQWFPWHNEIEISLGSPWSSLLIERFPVLVLKTCKMYQKVFKVWWAL